MSTRKFRSLESYEAEEITRNMLADFLRERGFRVDGDDQKKIGATVSQTVHAMSPAGDQLAMRVKLCWRRITNKEQYSAVQLLAHVNNNDWVGSLQNFVTRAKQGGVSHFLFVQREEQKITLAALVPVSELVAIWCDQRDVSKALGGKRKNHAMNGSSPTLWLEDRKAPAVADALWKHPGVIDLVKVPATTAVSQIQPVHDDTFDDMPGMDSALLGSDGAPRVPETRSYVKRDQRVRIVVLHRAGRKCERCKTGRDFSGFLDVHHILGAEKSDRVWNCVALCPNCHREAHTAPNCEEINAALLKIAIEFKELSNSAASGRV